MEILQMPRFKKTVKKLPRPFQQVVLDAIEEVVANPEKGESKKGDLEEIRVHKFKMNRQLTLLAYKFEGRSIIFYQVGTHENFYQTLRKYIRETGD